MRMYDLILKKKQGGELSTDEIRYMIEGFTEGSITGLSDVRHDNGDLFSRNDAARDGGFDACHEGQR